MAYNYTSPFDRGLGKLLLRQAIKSNLQERHLKRRGLHASMLKLSWSTAGAPVDLELLTDACLMFVTNLQSHQAFCENKDLGYYLNLWPRCLQYVSLLFVPLTRTTLGYLHTLLVLNISSNFDIQRHTPYLCISCYFCRRKMDINCASLTYLA